MGFINVTVDASKAVAALSEAQTKDIPYATAVTLTRLARASSVAEQFREAQVFHLRNRWTQDNTKFRAAEKTRWPITSYVVADTSNETAPNYLALQEEGGEKIPYSGKEIAVPTKYLRAIAPATIPGPLRPRNLLPANTGIGVVTRGRFEGPVTGTRAKFNQRVGARKLKKLGSVQYVAFKQYDRRGTLCIFVRVDGKRDAEPWYILTTRANVKAVLGLDVETATIVEENFDTFWNDAWASIRG
ncbi:MAG TPA: hypothetical protein VMD97_02025 [Candidatus Aquilonibacter sp.]|nr:hypothetical protein [Candidatus Aquilonibacter sp.]